MLCPPLDKIVHNECKGFGTLYFRYFKEPDALFGPILLKKKLSRVDGVLVLAPPLTCNTCPSIIDTLLCEDYPVTFGLEGEVLPELSNFIQFH